MLAPIGQGDRLVLNLPFILMKWEQASMGALVPGPDTASSIIDRWILFNQRDTFVAQMRNLYPTSHCIPVVSFSKEYFIPFPDYLDKKSYQCLVEDGMHMRNHDFNETVELVCLRNFLFI